MKIGDVVKITKTDMLYPSVAVGDVGMICSSGKIAGETHDPIYDVLIDGFVAAFYPEEFVIIACKAPKIVV
jgi:hypothetical protein